ncbi:hypothetical protein PAXRUDRAFT_20608 [Paxillus rubicundulus Ve08.2h10]|uniref:Uncharacterized protein n=1 Tax=Paxillus rubicundulus Ve08.2h10 TaxID=930991 RepID=A0A0D0D919_9AGAM|nr:hypothetical protein PAXRUDRAFT_20608 [Paxillus rubicundulus Ve08.2h10]
MNAVDCPELRDLLLFIGGDLADADIPHHTKLGELITERYKVEYAKMLTEIQNSLGRVSFMSDMWTNQDSKSFMAVTAHYWSHSGKNIAQHFLKIVEEIGALQ